jgi:hypothetical protein
VSTVPPCAPDGVILLGTGRCGSTLLADLLNSHPEIAAIQEVWSYRANRRDLLRERVASGPHLWELLSAPIPERLFELVRHGRIPTTRLSIERGDSALLRVTLPALFADPWAALGKVRSFLCGRPEDKMSRLLRGLFAFLGEQTGATVWLERTGGSLRYVGDLLSLFGKQRWIVLLRDGRETVASMAGHPTFVYGLLQREHPARLHDGVERLKCGAHGSEVLGWEPFARSWVRQVTEEMERLEACAEPGTVCRVYFEDLMAFPEREVERLARFVGIDCVEPSWLERVRRAVEPPSSKFSQLSARERATIEGICRPGLAALGYS